MSEAVAPRKERYAKQEFLVKSGNELAAYAAKQINYHIMGYYPITPSTAIAESLDELKAEGLHDVAMIPAEGEHSAAGICFGGASAGGRVFNATSANGLLYSIEQLPVQSGSRFPMVLNLVNRTVSGPLSIKGDHSDVMYTLNTGWIILMAKDPQRVYDFNIIAVKIGELEDVRLPVIVGSDGFFTSHQKRKVSVLADDEDVRKFIGLFKVGYNAIDPDKPVTIGPYMNEPDLINNKKQLSEAMEQAYLRLPQVLEEYAELTGRRYSFIDTYQMEDADAAIFALNSTYDTVCEAVDKLRSKGKKVGAMSLTLIRPFPADEIRDSLKNIKALCVLDRQDSYGAGGGNMTLEIKAALKDDPDNRTLVYSRIYGLSGKELYVGDAVELLETALEAAKRGGIDKNYDYFGATQGDSDYVPERVVDVIDERKAMPGIISVTGNQETGKLAVKGVVPRKLTEMPKRIVSGHGACPGCGIFTNLNIFMKGIEGHVVVLFHTGCGMVVTTGYPFSSFRNTYIHNLFQSGAATLSGVVEMYKEKQRRGEIPNDVDLTFIMVTGDGGNDIGMGSTIGAALRNHRMIILEYDNEGYMNTGNQLSYATPLGSATSTSHVGPAQAGKKNFHKDTVQIMAGCHIPYIFTAVESNPIDMIKKAAKAQRISKEKGLVYGKVLSYCPLNWRAPSHAGNKIIEAAVNCNFFPLYEIEDGMTTLNYDPKAKDKKIPVIDWLKMTARTRHLAKPEYEELADAFQNEVDRRWARLKAMAENPLL